MRRTIIILALIVLNGYAMMDWNQLSDHLTAEMDLNKQLSLHLREEEKSKAELKTACQQEELSREMYIDTLNTMCNHATPEASPSPEMLEDTVTDQPMVTVDPALFESPDPQPTGE